LLLVILSEKKGKVLRNIDRKIAASDVFKLFINDNDNTKSHLPSITTPCPIKFNKSYAC